MLYRVETFLSPKIEHIMREVYDKLINNNINHEDVMISIEIITVIETPKQEVRQLELFE